MFPGAVRQAGPQVACRHCWLVDNVCGMRCARLAVALAACEKSAGSSQLRAGRHCLVVAQHRYRDNAAATLVGGWLAGLQLGL